MFVCTVPRSSAMRGTRGEPLGDEDVRSRGRRQGRRRGARAHAAPRRGEDADLPHRPAEHAAMRSRPGDQLAVPARSDPPGRAEPLGERDRDEFERRGKPVSTPSPLATAAFQSRAPSRKVAMPRSRAAAQMRPPRRGKDDAAGAVVRVLDLDEGGRRVDAVVARLDRGDELRRREDAACADLGELHAAFACRAAGLVPDRMALAADDHVVAGPRQDAQRHLVGHRAARQPERASLPSIAATVSWSRLIVGSSPYWSSPTGAAAIAARISGVGRVTVSERRSIGVHARGLTAFARDCCSTTRSVRRAVRGRRALDDLREATAVARRLQVLVEDHRDGADQEPARPS
jgi:hypothetical protein